MKVSREEAAASRERILDVAAKLFRERGLDGIGVADLMHEAGLTHGGFYGHFESKEDLMGEAIARALSESLARWHKRAESGTPLSAIAKSYLSARHRDDPGTGCALPALAADVARHGAPVRRTFTAWMDSLVDVLAGIVPGRTKALRRRKAIAIFAAMAGAMVLARAVDDTAMSEEILNAVAASVDAIAA
jgi:TetR/AcrR family transcriptional repressor of nem operon